MRPSKEEYYLNIAKAVSKRSPCLRRHYGCIIVKDDEIIATGYNGSPRGGINCCDRGICHRKNLAHNTGDYSECCSVHAEQNAMLSASRSEMIGATMYLYGEEYQEEHLSVIDIHVNAWYKIDAVPCPICSRMIKNSGIIKVVNGSGEVCL